MIKHINIYKKVRPSCPIKKCEEFMELLSAMSDSTRQEIIGLFYAKKELRANDIANNFELSRPTISHHLNLMKRSGILISRKSGKEIYYSLNKKIVIDLLTSILNSIKKSC